MFTPRPWTYAREIILLAALSSRSYLHVNCELLATLWPVGVRSVGTETFA
jgi:hypothetical protein